MDMDTRWFASDERVEAKRSAKKKKARVWKYIISTRNGKQIGYYVGAAIPKVLIERNAAVENVAV